VSPTLHIENNGVPIYVQIREQILRAIGSGELRPAEQLPTMREVAVAVKVDLNTVRHAYDELEELGVVAVVRGRGTYVSDRPPPVDTAARAEKCAALAQRFIALAVAAGLDPADVARQTIQLVKLQGARK
jgi:GntR family transcriptional regulator